MKQYNNIVVTGALGQDGIILSKILIKNKFRVYGIVRKTPNYKNKIKNVIYKSFNLKSSKTVKKNLDKINPLCLVHLGTDNPNFYEVNNKSFYKNNLLITKNLINYFSKYKPGNKLIIIGSSQMYQKKLKKINLKTPFRPINYYAKFRVDSFNYMLKSKQKFKSNMVMAILFNHDSAFRKKKFLLPRLIKLIRNKNFKELNKIYKENISGDYSHAEDICNALYKLILINKNINKIILSSGKKSYINDVIIFLLKKNKKKLKLIKDRIKIFRSPVGDNGYARKLLKWRLKKNILIAAQELNKSI